MPDKSLTDKFYAALNEPDAQKRFDQLRMLRFMSGDKAFQEMIAPAEHAAFAETWTRDNPLLAAPGLLAAAPGYAAYKYAMRGLGLLQPGSTDPSLAQIGAGYSGLGKGLYGLLTNR